MPIATGVNGTLKINNQTRIQNAQFKSRSDGNTSKGAANYDSMITMFPNSPVHLDSLNLDPSENRGGYLSNDVDYKSMFASVIDGDVNGGFGFESDTVNLNYAYKADGALAGPNINKYGYVDLGKQNNLTDNPPQRGMPNTRIQNRSLSAPDEQETMQGVQGQVNDGFGIPVSVRSNGVDPNFWAGVRNPDDRIGKYFTSAISEE